MLKRFKKYPYIIIITAIISYLTLKFKFEFKFYIIIMIVLMETDTSQRAISPLNNYVIYLQVKLASIMIGISVSKPKLGNK